MENPVLYFRFSLEIYKLVYIDCTKNRSTLEVQSEKTKSEMKTDWIVIV